MKIQKEQFDSGETPRELPEDIRNELEVVDRLPDKEFWTEKNLEYWFGKDDMFGVKLCEGFLEMLGGKLKKDSSEYEEFKRLIGAVQNRALLVLEKARAAIELREFVLKTFNVSLDQLTARNILTHAYISEAEAMRKEGMSPEIDMPFTLGLRPDNAQRLQSFFSEERENVKAETDAAVSQTEIAKFVNAFYQSPELFENYVQWLDDVASAIGQKRPPAEIAEQLRSIGQAEREKSSDRRDIIAKQIICIRQMKKNLRNYGVADEVLSDAAFQKWLQSKKR
ncbi:hypothetical protein KGQ34_01985 [Patescibacteria group bacterium]|nr:hypothetical protein [Patescibacteria group bacterium]